MRMFRALTLLVIGSSAAGAQSPDTSRHDMRPNDKLWIEGGSNVHDWSCKASTFEARTDVDASREDSPGAGDPIKRVSVKVAVRDLKCGNGKMERNLYTALKADDPSTPSYIIGIFNAVPGSTTRDSSVQTEGTITVAGVEKGVRVRIIIEHLADGTITAHGAVPLLMTDFGVTPPTGLFGLIRSHNEIVVKFELVVARLRAVTAGR